MTSPAKRNRAPYTPFSVHQAVDGTWFFRIKAKNGNILATGAGYDRKRGAEKGITSILTAIRGAKVL